MLNKITFYFGLTKGLTGEPVSDYAIDALHWHLANNLEAYTCWHAEGRWNGQTESTLVVEWMTTNAVDYRKEANDIAACWRTMGEQESVLVTFETIDAQFLSGEEEKEESAKLRDRQQKAVKYAIEDLLAVYNNGTEDMDLQDLAKTALELRNAFSDFDLPVWTQSVLTEAEENFV